MKQVTLNAELRTSSGKGYCRKIRAKGLVPGVVYGKGMVNKHILLDNKDINNILTKSGMNVIIDLKLKDLENLLVMVQNLQKDVFYKNILHIDFHKISLEEKVTAAVPIILSGTPLGVKEGGILDHILWELEIEALPLAIPENIEVDVSSLKIDESIRIKDLNIPEGVSTNLPQNEIVAIVHPPRVEEEKPVAEVGVETPKEPEVITAKKEIASKE